MMTTKHILTGLILFTLTTIQVQRASATALGLAEGMHNITVDFPGTSFDSSGTMTIGTNGVTAFDVLSNFTSDWQCTPCDVLTNSPDLVISNNPTEFSILDTNPPGATHVGFALAAEGQASVVLVSFGLIEGVWSVPEPSAFILFGLGAVLLYVRRRRLS